MRGVAFDLDGTLYLGDTVVPGAVQAVNTLRAAGVAVVYMTNSSVRGCESIARKLRGLGFDASSEDVYASGVATARYVAQAGYGRVHVVGTESLREEMRRAGVTLAGDPGEADALVVGMEPHGVLPPTLARLPARSPFIACNVDATFPVENGRRLPGCGATVAAVQEVLGRAVDRVIGKPGTCMLELLEGDKHLASGDLVVVGDSIESDVTMAMAAGCRAILVADDPIASPGDQVTVVPTISAVAELVVAWLATRP